MGMGVLTVAMMVAKPVGCQADVSPAYNSYSFRQLMETAYDYAPLGAYWRSYSGTRTLKDRTWMRFQGAYSAPPTGWQSEMRFGWTQPMFNTTPGPIVRAHNTTRIRYTPNNNSMIDIEISDGQSGAYSCDARFDGPAYRYHRPGDAPWVPYRNPALDWPREVWIEVDWHGVVGGLTWPNIVDSMGIPSFLQGIGGTDRNSRTGNIVGTIYNGYVSIAPPQGATAQGHRTGWIDHQ